MKILAIDFGIKRMGFAVGSLILKVATPMEHLERKDLNSDFLYIKSLIDDHDIGKILIGLPLNMDGSKGAIVKEVENFYRFLKKRVPLQIELIDERLTSFEAEEILKENIKDFKKRKGKIDSMSAMVILNQYFLNK